MNTITDFLKKKLGISRQGQFPSVTETPPVNMTRVLVHPRNILIMPYNRMGTTLLATRVFKSFREQFVDAKISVAVYDPWSALISKDPAIDQVLAFGDDVDNPSSKGFLNIGQMLAEQRFDLAFFLSYQFDPAIAHLMRLSAANLRVAFRTDSDVPLFNVEIVPASGIRYEVERYLELLRTLGIQGSVRDYTLKISDAIREKARLRFIPGHSPAAGQRYIGFDLTREIAGDPIGKKTAEQIIATLATGFDATVIAFFEPQKKGLAAELKESFGKKLILVEDRPISMMAGLMSFCRFVVAHNTDLLQLAIALRIPTLGILTASDAIQWSPGESTVLKHLERSGGSWPSGGQLITASKSLLQDIRND